MSVESDWQPAGSNERIRAIDIIRGLALFGVLIVNIMSDFRVPLLEHIQREDLHGMDYWVELLSSYVLEFKAFTIFSFLFGVGIAIQMERAATRGVSARDFLLRRMGWLLVFGAIHLLLIWNGEILTLYAVCGLLLLPFIGLSWRILLVLGAALIVLSEFVSFAPSLPSGTSVAAYVEQARRIYGNGGYPAILAFRWRETWALIVPLLIMVLPRTAGLMFWGVAAWRSGILQAPERNRGKLVIACAIGALSGIALTAKPWPAFAHTHLDPSVLLALAYVSGLLLWLTPRRNDFLPGVAALGRMALTNYLIQSIVLGYIFYGYGFGLFGRTSSAAAASIGIAIYLVQAQFSKLWLRHFYFGPFEWLWRSLSYGRQWPLRR